MHMCVDTCAGMRVHTKVSSLTISTSAANAVRSKGYSEAMKRSVALLEVHTSQADSSKSRSLEVSRPQAPANPGLIAGSAVRGHFSLRISRVVQLQPKILVLPLWPPLNACDLRL